ncbi:hypothetical protein AAC387_Pa07g2896 [Persea americana]
MTVISPSSVEERDGRILTGEEEEKESFFQDRMRMGEMRTTARELDLRVMRRDGFCDEPSFLSHTHLFEYVAGNAAKIPQMRSPPHSFLLLLIITGY